MGQFHQYSNNSYILPKEVLKIIKAVPGVSKHPERDTLIIEIGWETGARVSEVLGLVPEHVLEQSIVLTNLKQRHKGKPAPTKIVEVTPELCTWIKKYCESNNIAPGQWVFSMVNDKTRQLHRNIIFTMITRASEAAKVFRLGKANPRTGGRYKGISYHVLRHSYAVYLLRKTDSVKTVQKQLGHANIMSTNAYADIAFDDVRVKVANAGVHLYHPD